MMFLANHIIDIIMYTVCLSPAVILAGIIIKEKLN